MIFFLSYENIPNTNTVQNIHSLVMYTAASPDKGLLESYFHFLRYITELLLDSLCYAMREPSKQKSLLKLNLFYLTSKLISKEGSTVKTQ